tara:strand:- start:91 stop:576 length:486 start_codon:yes stop_codon:yes gene_type:complete
MFNLKAEFYLKTIFLFSFIALISAFFIEYVLGHQPCNLCLIERIPYGLSIMIIMAIFLIKKNQKFLILLLILTFTFSFAISFYHFGIEQDFFQESSVCGVKSLTESITKEDLLKQLSERTISCRDVTFRIFGLSLTFVNVVISLFFIISLLKIFKKYEKNR